MNRQRRRECTEAVKQLSAAYVAIGRILTAEQDAQGETEATKALDAALSSVEFAQEQLQKASAI